MGNAVTDLMQNLKGQPQCGQGAPHPTEGNEVTQVETEHVLTPAQQDWVDALKSGDYPQATGVLSRVVGRNLDGSPKVGFCCLGLLADRAIKAGAVLGKWLDGGCGVGASHSYYRENINLAEGGLLPSDVRAYIEFETANPSVPMSIVNEAVPEKSHSGECGCLQCRANDPVAVPAATLNVMVPAATLNDSLGYTLPEIGAIFELAFKRGVVR